jgi:hypothetical protein
VGIKTLLVYIFAYEPCKILAYIKYEYKMHPLPTNITSLFMPLQNVNAIKTLKKLHHKLVVEVVKILTIHCISHLIFCPIINDILKRKISKL